MEVDQVGWGERNSGEQYDDEENPEEDDSSINFVGGKSGGKHGKGGKGFGKSKGKGFQGYCYTCGELGHAARECPKGKGQGRVWSGDWDRGGDRKGYGKGASVWPRACFQCGSLDHFMKDCPSVKVQAVEGSEEPEVLFIGRVDNWVNVPRSPPEGWFPAPRQGLGPRGATARAIDKPFQSFGSG